MKVHAGTRPISYAYPLACEISRPLSLGVARRMCREMSITGAYQRQLPVPLGGQGPHGF